MKAAGYAMLVLMVVPLQVTLFQYLSIGGIRPDLCLALVCLIGFLIGEREGLLLGVALGFMQDLFSVGGWWLNLATKGVAGLLAGVVGRQLVQTTPLSFLTLVLSLSSLSGLVFLFAGRSIGDLGEEAATLISVLVPQAAYDAAIAVGLYWLLAGRVRKPSSQGAAGTGTSSPLWSVK